MVASIAIASKKGPPTKKKCIRSANWIETDSHRLGIAKKEEWETWKSKNSRGNMLHDNEKWKAIVPFLEKKGVRRRNKSVCTIKWGGMFKN